MCTNNYVLNIINDLIMVITGMPSLMAITAGASSLAENTLGRESYMCYDINDPAFVDPYSLSHSILVV